MARPLTPRRGVCGRGHQPEVLPHKLGGGTIWRGGEWAGPTQRLTPGSHLTPWYASGRGTGKMAMGHMQNKAGFESDQKNFTPRAPKAAAVQRCHVPPSFKVRGLVWEFPPFTSHSSLPPSHPQHQKCDGRWQLRAPVLLTDTVSGMLGSQSLSLAETPIKAQPQSHQQLGEAPGRCAALIGLNLTGNLNLTLQLAGRADCRAKTH